MRAVVLGMVAVIALGCTAKQQEAEKAKGEEKPKGEVQQVAKKQEAEKPSDATQASPTVVIKTSKGSIEVQMDRQKAPKTVENFLRYAKEGFYAGTIFHRVIKGFMIQGGGLTPDMGRKQTHESITNEADNGLKNHRGTIAMARTGEPHSATSQFFINTVDNAFLNFQSKDMRGWGYCVFGNVVKGMDVVDAIEGVRTGSKQGFGDVPVETITIESVTVK